MSSMGQFIETEIDQCLLTLGAEEWESGVTKGYGSFWGRESVLELIVVTVT